jgi:signal transduction histidine kinase
VPIPSDIAAHLLVVVREGRSNVARHASATRVTVEVEVGDECVARVTDDGIGLPPQVPAGGSGLVNMRQRAEVVGGHFAVDGRREGGTILEWRVRPTTR